VRFVFLTFIGDAVSAIQKGLAAMHAPHVEKFFDGTVGSFPNLWGTDELDPAHVNKLLQQLCKGAQHAAMA
jgi:hypothetical protein